MDTERKTELRTIAKHMKVCNYKLNHCMTAMRTYWNQPQPEEPMNIKVIKGFILVLQCEKMIYRLVVLNNKKWIPYFIDKYIAFLGEVKKLIKSSVGLDENGEPEITLYIVTSIITIYMSYIRVTQLRPIEFSVTTQLHFEFLSIILDTDKTLELAFTEVTFNYDDLLFNYYLMICTPDAIMNA